MIRTATFKGKEYRFEDNGNVLWDKAEQAIKDEVWNLREGDIVLDIGAGEGQYTLTAAIQGALVYAFEPNPDRYSWLRHNIDLNPPEVQTRIKTLDIGVMDRPAAFNYSKQWNSFFMHSEKGKETEMAVRATTVDQFVEDNKFQDVNFLNIDVEGSELFVLEGAKKTLAKYKPHILLEAHTFLFPKENHLGKIDELLRPYDYQCLMFSYLRNDKYKQEARRRQGNWYYGALLYFEVLKK